MAAGHSTNSDAERPKSSCGKIFVFPEKKKVSINPIAGDYALARGLKAEVGGGEGG